MIDKPRAKYADGRRYDGHKQFLGNGIRRSCDKCGNHVPHTTLLKHKGRMCCEACRGIGRDVETGRAWG